MNNIKVISFDVEGTLVTLDFSHAIWHEDIPLLYAKKHGISFDRAKALVETEYERLGDGKKEWYDIKHWFKQFRLGDYRQVLDVHKRPVIRYPEVPDVLSALEKSYTLIITSSSSREFLPQLLDGIDQYFDRVFSTISDYGLLKAPDLYRLVCQELGVKPDEMVHVGDSWQYDFVAASQSGIRAFHVHRGNGLKESISLSSLTELVNLLAPQV